MSDDSERKWIHPTVLRITDNKKHRYLMAGSAFAPYAELMAGSAFAPYAEKEWHVDKFALLTPRARAVLEAVEEADRACAKCCEEEGVSYNTECGICRDAVNLLNVIRKAMEENK